MNLFEFNSAGFNESGGRIPQRISAAFVADYELLVLGNLTAEFEARYALAQGTVRSEFFTSWKIPALRQQEFASLWSLTGVSTDFDASYRLILGTSAEFDAEYRLKLELFSEFEAPYSLRGLVPAEFEAPYSLRSLVQTELESSYTFNRTLGVFDSPYDVRGILSGVFDATYMLATGSVQAEFVLSHRLLGAETMQSFDATWGYTFSVEFETDWNIRGRLGAEFVGLYDLDLRAKLSTDFDASYGLWLQASFEVEYPIRGPSFAAFDGVYNLTNRIPQEFAAGYDMLAFDPILSVFSSRWLMPGSSLFVLTGEPKITLRGRTIDVRSVRISRTEDQVHWIGNLQIANHDDFLDFVQGEEFTLSLFGDDYVLVVDSKEVVRSAVDSLVSSISGVSKTRDYETPRADPYSVTYEVPVTARAAAEAALSSVIPGTTIDWQIVDWTIPAYRLAAEQASPLVFARTIVEAAGGVLESKKDGTFLARKKFPVATNRYDDATPDLVLAEVEDILELSEQLVPRRVYDSFRIVDVESDFQDRLEYIASESVPDSGVVNVYPSPFRTNVRLQVTSPVGEVSVAPAYQTVVSIREEAGSDDEGELIEVINGQGSVAYPIYSVSSLTWLSESLGGIVFEPDATTFRTTDPTVGYGLMLLKYNTRYLQYAVASSVGLPAQFILEEI